MPDVSFTPATLGTRIRHPHLKACRAKEHLDALDNAIERFSESKPYRLTTKEDLKAGEYVIEVELLGEPPLDLGLIAGDFITCLRSSLDYLAYQLACAGCAPANPSSHVQFPIIGKYTTETDGKIKRFTEGMSGDAVRKIVSLQPYQHGNAYKASLLWQLNALANIVKHRHPGGRSHGIEVLFRGSSLRSEDIRYTALNESRYEIRFRLARKPKSKLDPWIVVVVEFGDLPEGIAVTTKQFWHMYEFVAHKLIPSFASFLK